MVISADQVKELRLRTGAGMMECKKALVEAQGDIEKAIEEMRKSGQTKAAKKAGRVAAEGLITIAIANDHKSVAMVEINCETDFVARDENFTKFAGNISKLVVEQVKSENITNLENARYLAAEQTVEQERQTLIAKIGENIKMRRIAYLSGVDRVGSYLHGGRIGVIVALQGGDEALAKDIAMHIAASNPIAIDESGVSAEVLAKEKEIITAQSQTLNKPADIIEKMVMGRLKKYLAEVTLLGQPFVKNPDQTIATLLQQAKAKVIKFVRFEVGEGIEKESHDFVAEVMAQARGE